MTASSHATLYLSTAAWEAACGGTTEEIGFHEPGYNEAPFARAILASSERAPNDIPVM